MNGIERRFPGAGQLFDGWAGSGDWRVFHGDIPRRWLKRLDKWNREAGRYEPADF